jgi:acyl carrier protein
MNHNPTLVQINNLFREIFKNPDLTVTETTTATDVAGWDSLTHLQVIASVESTFGIKLKLTEIMRLKNVGDLVRFVDGHLAKK